MNTVIESSSESCPFPHSEEVAVNQNSEKSANTTNIYWSLFVPEKDWASLRIMYKNPTWLFKDTLDMNTPLSRSKALLKCPAHAISKQDTIVLRFPMDFDIKLDENGIVVCNEKSSRWIFNNISKDPEESAWNIGKRKSIHFKFSIILFAEENVELELFPPYLHKTSATEYGALSTGRFNIGQWFRPMPPDYTLWEGVRSFSVKENDPSMYLRFHTDKKINFQEFRMTDSIYSYGAACNDMVHNHNNVQQTLEERYDYFNKSPLRKLILQEIQKNLL